MKEKPILFSGSMVNAILDGRKVQTRRVIKPQPQDVGFGRKCEVHPYRTGTEWPFAYYERRFHGLWNSSKPLKCPFKSDILWVRETWGVFTVGGDHLPSLNYRANGQSNPIISNTHPLLKYYTDSVKWRPSIHMPKWACRIRLKVVDVSVERVQDISESDCLAEGVIHEEDDFRGIGTHITKPTECIIERFAALWDSINMKRGFGFEQNPWVWKISFEVME